MPPADSIEGAVAPRAWAPPRPLLLAAYVCLAATLFGAYAYTLWANVNQPGRAQAFIQRAQSAVHGH